MPSLHDAARVRPFVVCALAGLACLVSLALAAQGQPPPAQDPPRQLIFRDRIDLLHLDVSVLDKDRRPVRGLQAADFTVLEDGKPQTIMAFHAVDLPELEPPPTAWMRDVAPDVQTNVGSQSPEGRLFVLLLDDALIPDDLASIQSAKSIARKIVDRMLPSDRVAVVFSAGSRGTQNFTNDRAKLLAAIDTFNAGYAKHLLGWELAPANGDPPFVDQDALYAAGSVRTLRDVAETLIAAPQRRKALFYVSPGVPVDFASNAMPVRAGVQAGGRGPTMMRKSANSDLVRTLPELYRRMQRANVTMYPIDPCGLGGLEAYVAAAARATRALSASSLEAPPLGYDFLTGGAPSPRLLGRHMAEVELDFLEAAASNTGGIAVVNTNDFDPGIDKVFRENSSYYLLGYPVPKTNKPGSNHRLTVKVNRPDVTVRTRSGYDMPAADKPDPKRAPATPLQLATSGPVANDELPMQVSLGAVAVPGREDAELTIVLGFRQSAIKERTPQAIELQMRAFTPDGQSRGDQRQSLKLTLLPTPGRDDTRYELLSHVALGPGRYELRIAATRATDNLSGSVYADVVIPDFKKAAISLSGVMLTTSPSVAAVPVDAFNGILPVTPTTQRDFSRDDKPAIFFRIYQGGDTALAPATIAVKLQDVKGDAIMNTTEVFDGGRFDVAARSADCRFALPIANLAPGPYLLSLEVTSGKTTLGRAIRFAIR